MKNASSGVLAVLGDGNYPYAVPLNFAYKDNKIYFHCATNGHKLDAIKKNSKVSFCVVDSEEVVDEKESENISKELNTEETEVDDKEEIAENNETSEKDDNTISLSLLAGYMKVNIMKDIGSLIEVHTPNMSSIVKGTQFDVAFAENGSSIVVLRDGSIDVVTDNDQRILNPKEAYINTIDNNSRVINQNADSDPIVFLNKGEEASREDYLYTIENLMKAMENIPYNNNENFVSLVNVEESEKQLKDMELKQYRMIAANEGYYNTIIKLINLEPSKKNEMIAYARKSLTIYTANQKAISKMNTSVTKTREKFDRIRRKFDERMSASAN